MKNNGFWLIAIIICCILLFGCTDDDDVQETEVVPEQEVTSYNESSEEDKIIGTYIDEEGNEVPIPESVAEQWERDYATEMNEYYDMGYYNGYDDGIIGAYEESFYVDTVWPFSWCYSDAYYIGYEDAANGYSEGTSYDFDLSYWQ